VKLLKIESQKLVSALQSITCCMGSHLPPNIGEQAPARLHLSK